MRPEQSSDRVADALKLWLRFQRANGVAQRAMVEFSEFSAGLSDEETEALAKQIAASAVGEDDPEPGS